MQQTYQALVTRESGSRFHSEVEELKRTDLPAGDVLIRVHYSSLNYKDALSATGNRAVTKQYPHTPGIDAAGVIEHSDNPEWKVGESVIVTGFDLGMNTNGGFGEYIRVPSKWLIRLPAGMTLKESMIYGTAGFTAAMSVDALIKHDVTPEKGVVAVSGATGGVGIIAIGILARLGYQTAAISGKPDVLAFLKEAGATSVIDRQEFSAQPDKILLKPRFAGAVDVAGGDILAGLLKSTAYGGSVTACGLVNGGEIPATVFPFILRGVNLLGIDSVEFPIGNRQRIWEQLAGAWKPEKLDSFATEISLYELPEKIQTLLTGKAQGRFIVRLI